MSLGNLRDTNSFTWPLVGEVREGKGGEVTVVMMKGSGLTFQVMG